MLDFFKKRKEQVKDFQDVIRTRMPEEKSIEIPNDLYKKCPKCDANALKDDLVMNLLVCPSCNYHFRLDTRRRIDFTVDAGTFREMDARLTSENPLKMPDYEEKLESLYEVGLTEAVVTGIGEISGYPWAIAIMDPSFMMGSMGTVVGEKIVKLTEHATENRLPLIIFATSGGARMQEGILSLMQMAKTTAAISKHNEAGLLYISVLTDPTFGGVSASYATVADIILAEPEALIGFAGPRVIKQTIKQVLPSGFQSSEFLLEHGLIDRVVTRSEIKKMIGKLSKIFNVMEGDVHVSANCRAKNF